MPVIRALMRKVGDHDQNVLDVMVVLVIVAVMVVVVVVMVVLQKSGQVQRFAEDGQSRPEGAGYCV